MTLFFRTIWNQSNLPAKTTLLGIVLFLLQLAAYRSQAVPDETETNKKETANEINHPPNATEYPGASALLIPFLITKSDTGSLAVTGRCAAASAKNHPCTLHL